MGFSLQCNTKWIILHLFSSPVPGVHSQCPREVGGSAPSPPSRGRSASSPCTDRPGGASDTPPPTRLHMATPPPCHPLGAQLHLPPRRGLLHLPLFEDLLGDCYIFHSEEVNCIFHYLRICLVTATSSTNR
jgi:hypothetical protein